MNTCIVFVLCVLVCQTIEAQKKKDKEIKSQTSVDELKFSYDKNAYDGPSEWAKTYPACKGTMQSPIKLDLRLLQSKTIPKMDWSSEYKKVPLKMELYVLNHELVLVPDYGSGKVPTISGVLLNGTYALYSIVFHWGSQDGMGSLHATGTGLYDMEINVVFTNQKYKTEAEVFSHEDGMAIVSYLAKKREKRNPLLDTILDNFPSIEQVGTKVSMVKPFSLDKLFPELGTILVYKGSIPRPPCSEIVTWIFSSNILQVSECQLESFRRLYRVDSKLIDNIRPMQPANGRKVYTSE